MAEGKELKLKQGFVPIINHCSTSMTEAVLEAYVASSDDAEGIFLVLNMVADQILSYQIRELGGVF